MSLKRRIALALTSGTLVALALGAGSVLADPVRHFDTFVVQCGSDTLVVVSKPGSSHAVTVNGEPSNGVSILMGIVVTVDGVVVDEFHKPYTENQDVSICTWQRDEDTSVVAELLNTPR